ncbi:hypothetical protein [Aquimarina sp. RZ0]|nr:hypothetical protein [Aquimarina sp. RZ0]
MFNYKLRITVTIPENKDITLELESMEGTILQITKTKNTGERTPFLP